MLVGNFFANSTNLHQPFEVYSSSYSYKSPAGEMATTMAYPFTAAQWKELERQAMIYKCMISSVPVPSKDNRRKFIWEEMSYLEKWWRDASDVKRESFINLVQNGQLEIVGGGWVMNDEVILLIHMWLNETVGVIPKNSWSIDPFGYSSTLAYLLRRMGFENLLIHRTHYELKKELALHKKLEYVWRQSWDTEETTDIFVHMTPFYSYDIPHTCGPEPVVCCQFDFARMRGFVYERCPWGEHPVETDHENVKERALKLLDQYRKKSTLYRTNTLLVPLGDGFRYISIDEAEAQFRNYQLLFDYINSDLT